MKLGIVGGVSPFACANFYQELCIEYRKRNGFFPEIFIHSIEVSKEEEDKFFNYDIDAELLENMKKKIFKSCELFKIAKIDAVAICCNTLSSLFYEIAENFDFKVIITPVGAVVDKLATMRLNKSIVLGTGYTIQQNLFQNQRNKIIRLTLEDQKVIQDYIHHKNVKKNKNKIDLCVILDKYVSLADSIVLGCTDIKSSDISETYSLPIIDSNKQMLEKCLEAVE